MSINEAEEEWVTRAAPMQYSFPVGNSQWDQTCQVGYNLEKGLTLL